MAAVALERRLRNWRGERLWVNRVLRDVGTVVSPSMAEVEKKDRGLPIIA